MVKLAVRCPVCGCSLEPIGDVVKNPKNPDKVCCTSCRKTWLPHELHTEAGSLNKRDMQPLQNEEVPW